MHYSPSSMSPRPWKPADPQFQGYQKSFHRSLNCMITLKHEQSTTETAIYTSACHEPQWHPEFLMPFSAELHPVILDSLASKSAVTLNISGQGCWCLDSHLESQNIPSWKKPNKDHWVQFLAPHGTTQKSYVWQHCPEASWTSAALGWALGSPTALGSLFCAQQPPAEQPTKSNIELCMSV